MRLAAQFVVKAGSRSIPVKTNFVTYQIVPDANATFFLTGLDGNRPLLVALGDGRSVLPADALAIAFPVAIPPEDVDDIARIFEEHGLYVQVAGTPVRTLIVAERSSPTADVIAALNAVDPIVGTRPSAYRQTLGTFPNDPSVFGPANADLERRERALARALGERSTQSPWYGLPLISADGTSWLSYDDSGVRFRYGPLAGVPADAPVAGPVLHLVPVAVRVSEALEGASVARLQSLLVPEAAFYRGPASNALAGFQRTFAIAADRTELYAAGSITRHGAARLGADAVSASIVLARRRLERFAGLLGVRAGVTTMGAVYPSSTEGPDEVVTTGVAAAVDDQAHAAWRSVEWDDIRAPRPDAPLTAPFFVPISLPDERNSVTVRSREQRLVQPDFVRLDVSVPQRAGMPPPQELSRRLRHERGVAGVAFEAPDRPWGTARGYEVLLAYADEERTPAVVDAIREYYGLTKGQVRSAAVAAIADCERLEDDLTAAATVDATAQATFEAKSQHVQLRKLAIGAVHPLLTGDAVCTQRVEPRAIERATYGSVEDVAKSSTIVSLEVDLSFRTEDIQP
jgi:hypothetical protein